MAALIFATLGIALALHGRRAIRARVLNVAAVATSVAMNVLAAGHGWRDLAIWAMPPVAYALASDTAIGVVRAWTLARQKALSEALADDEATPLAILGGLLLWLLRLALAPVSTLAGFRAWVVEECPVAPGRRGRPAAPGAAGGRADGRRRRSAAPGHRPRGAGERGGAPRPPGSWPWSPTGTGRSRPSRSPMCRGSAPSWPPRSALTPARPGPRCAATSSRCRTGAPGEALPMPYFVLLICALLVAGVLRWCFGPHSRTCRGSGSGTCGCGCTCGCTRAAATRPCSSCGCGGAGWPRSAGPAASRPSLPAWQRLADPRAAFGAAGPGAVPARAAGAGGGAPADRWPRRGPARPRCWPGIILHYPGPVVSTTTKHDVFAADLRDPVPAAARCTCSTRSGSAACRRRSGGTRCAGCADPATAIRRADGFAHAVNMAGTEDASFWSGKASDYLRCLFHAAALAGGDMRLVARWALGSAEPAEDILAAGRARTSGPPSWPSCAARRRRPPRRSGWCCPGRWGS